MKKLTEYSTNHSEIHEFYGFIQKMNQLNLMQILLIPIIFNVPCIRLNYQKTLTLRELMEF